MTVQLARLFLLSSACCEYVSITGRRVCGDISPRPESHSKFRLACIPLNGSSPIARCRGQSR